MDLFSPTYGARTTPITAYRSGRNFVEVKGIQLVDWLRQGPTTDAFVRALNELVFEARVVVFRDQGIVAGADQVEISKWFNPLESTFYKHPMSPHPDVFRVSNDAAMGCTGVGRTGWHVDGSFQPSPFSHALYHILSVSGGDGIPAAGRVPPRSRGGVSEPSRRAFDAVRSSFDAGKAGRVHTSQDRAQDDVLSLGDDCWFQNSRRSSNGFAGDESALGRAREGNHTITIDLYARVEGG